ncbi:MAG: biopolymer transporter ExbD [Kiritimatiellae bacterium]|nr:biopolymer transporter ExbD [Kiritimatiellia bacterium]
MTSLMDVMFLVLVFFIYSIFNMAVHRGVKVEFPNASGVDEKGERLVATILPDDTLQLNGEAIGRDALVEKVAAQVAAGENPAIIIAGDKAASLGVGIELLSRLKAIGIEKVSFQVSGQDGK